MNAGLGVSLSHQLCSSCIDRMLLRQKGIWCVLVWNKGCALCSPAVFFAQGGALYNKAGVIQLAFGFLSSTVPFGLVQSNVSLFSYKYSVERNGKLLTIGVAHCPLFFPTFTSPLCTDVSEQPLSQICRKR